MRLNRRGYGYVNIMQTSVCVCVRVRVEDDLIEHMKKSRGCEV